MFKFTLINSVFIIWQ